MPDGTGLNPFAERFPERFFDVGIAEQHAMTFAAGLAAEGFRPVAAIYSTFVQRAYDQVFHDICLQKLPVTLALDRAGLVGDDGPTHHGVFDISFLRHLPELTVMAPKDENELRHMLKTAVYSGGPIALRYPRGAGYGVDAGPGPEGAARSARANCWRKASDLSHHCHRLHRLSGPGGGGAAPAEGDQRRRGQCPFRQAAGRELILGRAQTTGRLVTVEENALQGGFGSAVLELLSDERAART